MQFGQHSIPDALLTDNGPHFVRREFTEFAKQWEFQLVILSPYRPKSKRKAQSAVKVVKNLLEQALKITKTVFDSVELEKFAHSRHAAKPCPMVDVKKSVRFLYPEVLD